MQLKCNNNLPNALSVSSTPKVIACGHCQVIGKTGKSFPAFLVRIPGLDSDKADERYFWRSKRDFLLLGRARPRQSFPKKAFAKLSNQALNSGSWVCPDDDEAPSGGYCEIARRLSERQNSSNDDGDIVSDHFHPNMKKSLYQLDAFLLNALSASSSGDDNGAWAIFCRKEHTNSFQSSSIKTNCDNAHTSTAARLGQYFASDDNAQLVVRKTIELLGGDDERRSAKYSLVFIEPSCGDGRIISKLLDASKQIEADSINILGYDIDPIAVESAKTKLSGGSVLALECKNFLSLSLQDLLSAVSRSHSTTEKNSSRKRSRTGDNNRKVIVLGGPPYTPKKLPEQFILHSIQQLKADIVVFILPGRCKNDADSIQQILNRTRSDGTVTWFYSHMELANISFSFKESIVQQPSVLQCWYHN